MAGEMVCPRCRAVVVPSLDAQGGLHCPACYDTGVIQGTPPGWAAQSGAPPAAVQYGAAPNADGAVLALVFGILAIALPYIGVVFGILALVYAKKADRAIAASAGQLQGRGMVVAGRVLGVIGLAFWSIALLIILSAVVFVLVSNLGSTDGGEAVPDVAFNKDDSGIGGTLTVVQAPNVEWADFQVAGSAECAVPFGQMRAGDVIDCRTPGTVEIVHLPTNTLVYVTTLMD